MLKLRTFLLLTALSTLPVAACSHGPPPEPNAKLSRRQFVAVMTDIQLAQPRVRASILEKHHVTEADLKDFVVKYSAAPEYLAQAFDSIQGAVDRAGIPR